MRCPKCDADFQTDNYTIGCPGCYEHECMTDKEAMKLWVEEQDKQFMQVQTLEGSWTDIYDPQDEFSGTLNFNTSKIAALNDLGYAPENMSSEVLKRLEVEHSTGFRARLSAPGYMDCTDWTTTHETEDGAINELWEMYSDD